MIICRECREDIDAKGQVNASPIPGYPICEDCYFIMPSCDLYAIAEYLFEEGCEEGYEEDISDYDE